MAYPDETARVTLTWQPNPASWAGEIAVNTFWIQHVHFTGNTFVWSDAVQYAADQIASKLAAHWSGVAPVHQEGYGIKGVKVAQIAADGSTVSEGIATIDGGACDGSSSSSLLPPECAIKLGLFAYLPGGFTAHKGRKRGGMFLPYIVTSMLMADGRIRDDKASDLLNGWQTIFNDIQGMHTKALPDIGTEDDYWRTGIASRIDATFAQLNYLVVDNHVDSQRRRQHQTPATSQHVTISHS